MDDKSIIADQLNDLEEMMMPRRKELISWWIKFFSYIFLLLGALVIFLYPLMFLLGQNYTFSVYGLESSDRYSLLMLGIVVLFILKGCAAFGLLWEKDWAADIALIDGFAGIGICIFVIVYSYFSPHVPFVPYRLELVLLIGYVVRIMRIRRDWKRGHGKIV
ncbi:hypothetical protein [Chitinophaga agri]|uniref:Uncharacterized protein n=1 Tax=Chitinophaga agri TaxID=2703787 RepID=A0A6B9ZH84_9BACT|nr:hypothetical protein [Chitinophaga agri]QHS61119.1 hypothetical protein GWR21_16390 [Chitinophaga agri]